MAKTLTAAPQLKILDISDNNLSDIGIASIAGD
jgi:Leucine-rich repeat (LRR) protein